MLVSHFIRIIVNKYVLIEIGTTIIKITPKHKIIIKSKMLNLFEISPIDFTTKK